MPGIVLKRNCDCRIFVMLQFRTGSRVWRRVSFAAEFAEFRIVSVTPYRLWTARRKPQQNQNLFWLMQSDVVRLRFNEVRSLYIYKKSTIPCYSITLNRPCFNRVSNFANLNATLTILMETCMLLNTNTEDPEIGTFFVCEILHYFGKLFAYYDCIHCFRTGLL